MTLSIDEYIELVKAIAFLHSHGEKHGDIRRDHIIREHETGLCRWIDFDFSYLHRESMFGYDLFGLGNVLAYLAGRGDVTLQQLKATRSPCLGGLSEDDLNIIFNQRVMNLRKVYPYVPEPLNLVLLHFSLGAATFYDDTGQLLDDLGEVRATLPGPAVT